MKKTFTIFTFSLLIFSFLLLFATPSLVSACSGDDDCPRGQVCSDNKCSRPLELVYPKIPGFTHETVVFTGLPQYVEYIFNFAIWITGLILLSVLIYNGINYLTSAGNPGRLTDAKKGILAGFIGVLILLGAGIIFDTIDPHLVTLDTAPIEHVEPFQRPGVYICNYKVGDINKALDDYTNTTADVDVRIKGAKRLREIMGKAGDDQNCFRVVSTSLATMPMNRIDAGKEYTVFVVPERDIRASQTNPWVYKHGIVFHQKERAGGSGKCEIFPKPSDAITQITDYFVHLTSGYYKQIEGLSVKLDFTSTRITVFEKTAGERGELVLYEGRQYNQDSAMKIYTISGPNADTKEIPKETLEKHELYRNIRSFDIRPRGEYLVIFMGREKSECSISTTFSANLTVLPVGNCIKRLTRACDIGTRIITGDFVPGIERCEPCVEKILFIRGRSI